MFRTILLTIALSLSMNANSADLAAFQDFGETPGLVKVVDDLMVNLLANEKTRPFFEKVDHTAVKQKLVEQFCAQLEGPCIYTGQTMKRAHKGHEIDAAQFNALVEALQDSMNKNKIPQRAQNKLLAKLASMHKDIINK